jgi:hydrogenase expression/formation protein HypC
MCLAVPAEVVALGAARRARVSLGGVTKEIALDLVDDVAIGDYVLVHVGFALGKIDPEQARRTLEALDAAGVLAEELHNEGLIPASTPASAEPAEVPR